MHEAADLQGDIREMEFEDVEEVAMFHSLEHLSIHDAPLMLRRIHSWLIPGGKVTIEVPDMEQILVHPSDHWETDVYGVQIHDGEFHRSGYSAKSLAGMLKEAGFSSVYVHTFRSTHPHRPGMPCLMGTANA